MILKGAAPSRAAGRADGRATIRGEPQERQMPESCSIHEALPHSQAAASPGAPLRVFVATDLSELGMEAVRRGHEIALSAGGRLAVCHVQEPHDRRTRRLRSSQQWRVFGAPGDPGVARLELDGTIGWATGRRPEDLDVFIERGSPAEEILRGARRWKSDLRTGSRRTSWPAWARPAPPPWWSSALERAGGSGASSSGAWPRRS